MAILSFLSFFTLWAFFLIPASSFARPIHSGLASLLARRSYEDFQISDGYGGTAFEESWAIFQKPFEHMRYEDVPYNIYEHLLLMWEDAEYAGQVAFPAALLAAQSQGVDEGLRQGLSVGKTKNDVLLRMAEMQIYQIKKAKDAVQGQDFDDDTETLETYRSRLMEAVTDDRRNSGQSSKSIHLAYTV